MNDDKMALYESLIRASLLLIFFIALTVGTVGMLAISQMLTQQALHNSGFIDTGSVAVDTER
jgi:hypothetical protein